VTTEGERVAGFGRLEDGLRQASPWYMWGPYVSERQWGTVREDYSEDGDAWNYLPHDHARSRAFRWGEDGLAGFCDVHQRLCLGLALWNGRDPFLKERLFGLTGPEGNHGEDVKEHWWYLDALPSHAWNRWRYHYPQAAFPYDQLRLENSRRDRRSPEYEIMDTGVFDGDRYWVTEVKYAKSADAAELLMVISVTNAGPDRDTLHVLPTAWFRNTWSWDEGTPKPVLKGSGDSAVSIEHPFLGSLELVAANASDGTAPEALFCENETNLARLFGCAPETPYPKDGINDHVVSGKPTVNPAQAGTKCSFWYKLTVEPGGTAEIRLRLRPAGAGRGEEFDEILRQRQAEADEFYRALTPQTASEDEAMIMRQAFAGMLWSKQFYDYDVATWLDGDPAQPKPPPDRELNRNARWRNFNAYDIMSMPDKWEYPWFAAWDLAFHCVTLAHVDPGFAKYQLILLCREWFQHPNGALPAYEWDFSDVNPPVQAWAALEVFALDGGTDIDFLARIFDKLLINFTWWVNREDMRGNNLFEGGFLGLDNIGPIDRSHLPPGTELEQSDATGWMAFYALSMGTIATILWRNGRRRGADLVLKFLEHYAGIADALEAQGMWDATDGMFYDQLILNSGAVLPVKARSMVGMIPLLAVGIVHEQMMQDAIKFGKQFAVFIGRQGFGDTRKLREQGLLRGPAGGDERLLLNVVGVDRLVTLFQSLFDESRFLSPYGLRSLSAVHRDQPYVLHLNGTTATIDYEPAESTTALFGGNSNWRGPIWFPLNYLVISCLEKYHRFFGDDFTVEYPAGSGNKRNLAEIADDLRDRLISIFTRSTADGRRPCFGWVDRLQHDPRWRDNIYFNEYYHGDNAAGLGASHQTGWTGLIADVIRRRHGAVRETVDLVGDLIDPLE
jgi:Mannosylglycerate hydrolase MGH1-like glycoside hydrolase domain/Glycosyl hydrolase family 63 C-terminal domain